MNRAYRRRQVMTRYGTIRALGSLAGLLLLTAGCASHTDRWGRDPAKLKDAPPRVDTRQIEIAKAEFMQTREPDVDDDSPVSVLFINGDPLTVEDVLKWIRFDLEKMAESTTPDEYSAKLLDVLRSEVRARAESLLLHRVALRELGEPELERLDQFVDSRIREIVNRDHGGRESRYEDWLRERGITPQEDRERIRREMLVIAYLQRTVGGMVSEPTRREIEMFHEQYDREARAGEKRHMYLIDIPFGEKDATGRTVTAPVPMDDARRRATTALAKIRAGEDFAEVARKHSEGINAYSGGDWGPVTREGVRPRWKRAVEILYELDEGEVSEVVEADGTFFIVRCAAIERRETRSFAEMQPQLIEAYRNRQFDLLAREMVSELYSDALIRPTNPGRFLRAVMEAAPKPRTDVVETHEGNMGHEGAQ